MHKTKRKMYPDALYRVIRSVRVHHGLESSKPLCDLLCAVGAMIRADDGSYRAPDEFVVKAKYIDHHNRCFLYLDSEENDK